MHLVVLGCKRSVVSLTQLEDYEPIINLISKLVARSVAADCCFAIVLCDVLQLREYGYSSIVESASGERRSASGESAIDEMRTG